MVAKLKEAEEKLGAMHSEIDDAASEDLEDSDDERLVLIQHFFYSYKTHFRLGMGRSRDMMALPIKKRGRPKKILTDYEEQNLTQYSDIDVNKLIMNHGDNGQLKAGMESFEK